MSSRAALYRYFENKRDLLVKVIEDWYEAMLSDYDQQLSGISGTRNRLRYMIWRHLVTVHEEPALCHLMFQIIRSGSDYSTTAVHDLNRKYTHRTLDIVREGIDAGELRGDIPLRLVRDMIYGCVEHRTWAYLRGEGDFDFEPCRRRDYRSGLGRAGEGTGQSRWAAGPKRRGASGRSRRTIGEARRWIDANVAGRSPEQEKWITREDLVEANGNQKSAASVHRAGGLTVYELFAAQVSRDVTAIAIEQGELRLTYAALDARVRKLAGALLDMGATRGKRIALLSENRHEYIEIQLAAAFIGAILACQNWRLAPAELRHCVALVSPSLIIPPSASPRASKRWRSTCRYASSSATMKP